MESADFVSLHCTNCSQIVISSLKPGQKLSDMKCLVCGAKGHLRIIGEQTIQQESIPDQNSTDQNNNWTKVQQIVLDYAKEHKDDPERFSQIITSYFEKPGIDEKLKADALCYFGRLLIEHSFPFHALKLSNEAVQHYNSLGNINGVSHCYVNICDAYHDLGDYNNATKYNEQAMELAVKTHDAKCEASVHNNRGILARIAGNYKKAVEHYEKALTIANNIDDVEVKVACYTGMAVAYTFLSEYNKAIECHEKGLRMATENGYKQGQARCYTMLGIVYYTIGRYDKAFDCNEKALKIAEDIGDRRAVASCYMNIGNTYIELGYGDNARECYQQALQISEEIHDLSGQAQSYANIGNTFALSNNHKEAIKFQELALEIKRNTRDRYGELNCYMNMGGSYHFLGNDGKAIEYSKKALQMAKDIGDLSVESKVSSNLGMAYLERDVSQAYDFFKQSIDLSELVGRSLVEQEHKVSFYGKYSNAYQIMVDLCVTKDTTEAFEYVERSKSKAFLEMLAATEIKPTVNITKKLNSLLEKEGKALSNLRKIQMRHLQKTSNLVGFGEIDNIQSELKDVYDEIEKIDPEYVFIRNGKPISLNKIQKILSAKGNSILVEYFVSWDKLFIFVVTPTSLHTKTIPVLAEDITTYIKLYRKELTEGYLAPYVPVKAVELSKYLIEPIADQLLTADLICFIPYGLLHKIPLHSLLLNNEPLINNHAVSYCPSSSLLTFLHGKGTGSLETCSAFGVEFEDEAKEVADLFDTIAHQKITKEKVFEYVDKDILHFSCHGRFDDLDPLSSGIVLQDGTLTARDIFNRKLNSSLVTLSACQTGINERKAGDELIGLTRSFLYAGIPSIIVSLWSVKADSTKELMVEFYKQIRNGKGKAAALQAAQKKIMQTPRFEHPHYWAPFVLIGDWQ
jgi:CHAT domain-containing protein/tetratricopeptide (TPR) repeat protein